MEAGMSKLLLKALPEIVKEGRRHGMGDQPTAAPSACARGQALRKPLPLEALTSNGQPWLERVLH